ncbi:MAG: RHS repeat-associated core domain-containing protein, partial [Patescibacteria group bacterium]|nr:RHS repeat-associated core domain-containing protein [Patescibacteria group bacterium]
MSLATIDGVADFVDEYAHDSAGRLTALTYSQGETVLASYAWTYGDDGSSLLSVETTSPHAPLSPFSWIPSGGLMPGQDTGAIVNALWEGTGTPASLITEITVLDGTVSYQYDSAGQLLAATYTAGQAAESYSYDANGNRVTADGAAYLTGPNNQLLFDGVFSYSYDPEGNRTARFIDVNANGLLDAGDTAATTYAWDHRNRLTRVTDYDLYGDPATRAVDYLYDTENRWIGRDVDLDGDGQIDTRTRFAYDGNQIVMQFDRALAPNDDPADPLTLENLSHRYLWNPAAVDQLMADEHVTAAPSSPSSILWPLADHLGTIRDLAAYDSSTGTTTIVNHRTFDAYGNLQSQTTTAVDCLFAFTGRPLDQATDLQNNLHRWYDPAGCRWMTEDPIGFEGKDGNLYA